MYISRCSVPSCFPSLYSDLLLFNIDLYVGFSEVVKAESPRYDILFDYIYRLISFGYREAVFAKISHSYGRVFDEFPAVLSWMYYE